MTYLLFIKIEKRTHKAKILNWTSSSKSGEQSRYSRKGQQPVENSIIQEGILYKNCMQNIHEKLEIHSVRSKQISVLM